MDQTKIAETLKRLRKERRLTQEELAEKLFVSAKTVSRWETGTNLPDISVLVELADLYQVDIRDIILCERRDENVNDEKTEREEPKEEPDKVRNLLRSVEIMTAERFEGDKEKTAKRSLAASVLGMAALAAGFLLSVFGTGVWSILALIAFAFVFGDFCYILFNSTLKYGEATRKKTARKKAVFAVCAAVAAFLILLFAVTFAWFARG